jgi:hypothetical protein
MVINNTGILENEINDNKIDNTSGIKQYKQTEFLWFSFLCRRRQRRGPSDKKENNARAKE